MRSTDMMDQYPLQHGQWKRQNYVLHRNTCYNEYAVSMMVFMLPQVCSGIGNMPIWSRQQ